MDKEPNSGSIFQKLALVECLLYCIYPILCIVLIITASVCKSIIDYFADYTDVNLNIVPALIISAGCLGIISFLTRIYFKKSHHMQFVCFAVFPILFIFQITAAVYGCVQSTDGKQYLQKAVERDMGDIFLRYYKNSEIENRFNILQNELECCGVYGSWDYSEKSLPRSCCPAHYLGPYCHNETQPYSIGCASKVYEAITLYIGVLSYVTFGLIILQIICSVFILKILFNYFKERSQGTRI